MLKLFHSLNYGGQCHLPAKEGLAALRLENVSHRYPSTPEDVLSDVSLTVNPGERIALAGPNGAAGKSTLLKLILGMETLSRGSIDAFGNPATHCLHRVDAPLRRWKSPISPTGRGALRRSTTKSNACQNLGIRWQSDASG